MPRAILLATVLAAFIAGCSGGSGERDEVVTPESVPTQPPPTQLSQSFSDGKISLRYPRDWDRVTDEQWGVALGDNVSEHPAFVAVQYLPRREYASRGEFAQVAASIVRPPAGEGTTLLYTQTARVGGRRGVEAGLMVAVLPGSPLGPTVRVIGIELDSGEVAIVVFAAEQPRLHREQFAWIKNTIAWAR